MRLRYAVLLGVVVVFLIACTSGISPVARQTDSSTITTSSSVGAPLGSGAAAFEQTVVLAIQKVQPAVVEITVQTPNGTAQGSGTIMTSDGYLLTNDHVVRNGTSFQVTTLGGTYGAQLAGTDPADDLAVLKIAAAKALPTVSFADSATALVGQFDIAVGNPLGLGQSATFGIISALNRSVSEAPNGPANIIPNMIQTSAPINPGNSGGALIDLSGNVIGIPTLGALNVGAGNTPANGIGFAIPANHAKFIADQIIKDGKVTNTGRAALGVEVADVTPAIASQYGLSIDHGVIIKQLVAQGPAERAGLQINDIIYQIASTTIDSSAELGALLATLSPGGQITVSINRNARNMQVQVTLGTLPSGG